MPLGVALGKRAGVAYLNARKRRLSRKTSQSLERAQADRGFREGAGAEYRQDKGRGGEKGAGGEIYKECAIATATRKREN